MRQHSQEISIAADYWNDVAGLTSLIVYPQQGPFGQKEGSAIGKLEGYTVAIGPAKNAKRQSAIGFLFRYKPVENPETVVQAAKSAAGKKQISASTDSLLIQWTYSLGKPKAAEVAELAAAVARELKAVAAPPDGRCELCQSASVSELSLMQGVPGHYCENCQWKAGEEARAAAGQYEAMDYVHARKPKFEVVFEKLGQPGQGTKGMGASA